MKLRQAISSRLAPGGDAQGRCCVDYALYAPARSSLFLMGWVAWPEAGAIEVAVEDGAGNAARADWTARYSRPDVVKALGLTPPGAGCDSCGIAALVPLQVPLADDGSVQVTFRSAGKTARARVQISPAIPEALRTAFFSDWQRLAAKFPEAQAAAFRFQPAVLAAVAQPAETYKGKFRFSVDQAVQIPERGHFVQGWCHDPDGELAQMLLLDEDGGTEAELTALWERVARPDVAAELQSGNAEGRGLGFLTLVPVPAEELGRAARRLAFYALLRAGDVVSVRRDSEVIRNDLEFCKTAMQTVSPSNPRLRQILDLHVGPAIERAWRPPDRSKLTVDVREFGAPTASPRTTVIVPLYGRHDFMQFQLALFADDPAMREADLIYVVDDPALYEPVLTYATAAQLLFGVPFRTVHAGRNLGYAGANNLGAAQARGEFLVLLNSDVMPRQPGWLPQLIAELEQLPQAGIVGAKLLYEDGSIQHAGIRLERYAPWDGLWINVHPGKGQPDTAGDTAPRVVQAVTGACMAMRRGLYEELGGLDEGYLLGDFEDSDLCHLAGQKGLKTYYLPSVALYHLERQSLVLLGSDAWRSKLTLYNCWRHGRRLGLD